ncbi:MAG: protein kinase, partial [Phycisphaerae bacterium]
MSVIESYSGSVSDERFELIKPLGAGAFAQTYKARVKKDLLNYYETDLVALKVPLNIEKELRLQDDLKVNAYLEYVLSQMEARNIVRYFGVSVFDGRLVMVMEYIEGGSLRNKIGPIEYQKNIPVEDAVRITIGVLEGLIVLHRANLLHCDLKPENILMDGLTPKICDFNLSKIVKADELASFGGGTLPYMSPEVLGKKIGSFSSDIWSLGVTLYEMLAGKLPFYDSNVEKLKKLIVGDVRHIPVREVQPQISEKLSNIVDKALEKDLRRRYKTAQEMRLALIDFTQRPDSVIEHEMATIDAITQSFIEQPDMLEDKLREMVSRYPKEPRGYQRLGEYLNRAYRFRDAIRVFSEGLKHDPINALLHWYIAMAYLGIGNNKDAMK